VIALTREDGPVERLVLRIDDLAGPLRAAALFPLASIPKLATALAILGCCTFESWWQSWSAIGAGLLRRY